MRIDANLPLSIAPESASSKESKKVDVNPPGEFMGPADEARLSGVSDQVSALHAELSKIPDVRQDRVNALVDALRQGTWNPSPQDIAQAMFADLVGRTAR